MTWETQPAESSKFNQIVGFQTGLEFAPGGHPRCRACDSSDTLLGSVCYCFAEDICGTLVCSLFFLVVRLPDFDMQVILTSGVG